MAGYEQSQIIGHVGRDVESRQLGNGTTVASFSVAVSRKWTDKQSGEKRESTNWYKVSAWGRLGEIAVMYVTKGAQIMVVGTVTASAYMGQDGEPRASLDLRAETFQLLGGGNGQGEGQSHAAHDDKDIPF